MKGELIAVGSELLLFGRRDTNGDWLAGELAALGIDLARRTVVGDDEGEIAEAIDASRRRAQVLVVTGGLGPTADDLTREGLARALGVGLRVEPRLREAIAARLAARGLRAAASAESQARVPEGVLPIANPVGSAPGLLHEGPPCWTVVLPGVPGEMRSMFVEVAARLRETLALRTPPVRHLLVAGIAESEVDARLEGLIGSLPGARVTILASEEGVELHILGLGEDPALASANVARIEAAMRERLGELVVGQDGETLPGAVGRLLLLHRATLAVAESCTGGLLGAAVTSVPGASAWFVGGFLVYSDALKEELVGVPKDLLHDHGAVSEPVARAMAEGARRRARASYALAITGIAGPDGGSDEKPVGLVHVALAAPERTSSRRWLLGGARRTVRTRSVTGALDLLRRELLAERPGS